MIKEFFSESEIIGEIKKLQEIKPDEKWVSFTKENILGKPKKEVFFHFFKPAISIALSLILIVSVVSFSQNSLPGDPLYKVKTITENIKANFLAFNEIKKVDYNLKIAQERLKEIEKIVKSDKIEKLPEALVALEKSKENLNKVVSKIKEPKEIKKIIPKIKETQQKEQEILTIITQQNSESKEPTEKILADYLIKNLEKATLTEKQKELLTQAEEFFQKGDWQNAYIKALQASQIK